MRYIRNPILDSLSTKLHLNMHPHSTQGERIANKDAGLSEIAVGIEPTNMPEALFLWCNTVSATRFRSQGSRILKSLRLRVA